MSRPVTLSPTNDELDHFEPQKTGTTVVVECITGPPDHWSSETCPPGLAWFAWLTLCDGTKPEAAPAARLGGPPAGPALAAAATPDASARLATTAIIHLKLMLLPPS